jgi:HK97 family phage major capsid protein
MSTINSLAGAFQTEQQAGFAGLMRDLVAKIDGRFSDLEARVQKGFIDGARDIAKLNNDFGAVQSAYAERFRALADDHQRGGNVARGFSSRQTAEQFGRMIAAIYKHDGIALDDLRRAGISPGTGPEGGYLLTESMINDIMREVDPAGVFTRNCPPAPVDSLSGGSPMGTSGPTMYYPDFGVAGTVSTPGFGGTKFALKRHVAIVEVDNWMLASGLAIPLAEYVRQELAYAVALATDTNWFMGDGTSPYCQYTGLFKLASGVQTVTAESGDDTFSEVVAKTTYYLAQAMGKLPLWAHAAGPKWYMHPLTFFGFLGVRDTAGMPIANVFLAQNGLPFHLMGYPVELVSVAPSTTAVSTCFMVLAALARACRTYRHNKAVEFKMTDQLKWKEAITHFACDVPLDMLVRNGDGIVQVYTHS